jgi:hypothetical protein
MAQGARPVPRLLVGQCMNKACMLMHCWLRGFSLTTYLVVNADSAHTPASLPGAAGCTLWVCSDAGQYGAHGELLQTKQQGWCSRPPGCTLCGVKGGLIRQVCRLSTWIGAAGQPRGGRFEVRTGQRAHRCLPASGSLHKGACLAALACCHSEVHSIASASCC